MKRWYALALIALIGWLLPACIASKPAADAADYTHQVRHAPDTGVLATPDGTATRPVTPRQARQYRKNLKAEAKLARASVPRKIGKGGIYAPAAEKVTSVYKADAPVAAGDSASVRAVKAKNSAVATDQAVATAAQAKTTPLKAVLKDLIGLAVLIVVIVVAILIAL